MKIADIKMPNFILIKLKIQKISYTLELMGKTFEDILFKTNHCNTYRERSMKGVDGKNGHLSYI